MNTNHLTRDSFERLRQVVKLRDNGTCQYCGTVCESNGQVDHILSLVRGGRDSIDNLVWACKSCNVQKGDKTLREWVAYLLENVGERPRRFFELPDPEIIHVKGGEVIDL